MEYSHFTSRYHRRKKYIDHDYRKHFESQITWWFVWNKEMGICSVANISNSCRSGRGLIYGVLIIVVCACAGLLWLQCEPESPQDFSKSCLHGEEDLFFSWLLIGDRGIFFSCWLFFAFKNGSQIEKDFNEANNNTYLLYLLAFQPRGIPSTRSTAFAWVGSV